MVVTWWGAHGSGLPDTLSTHSYFRTTARVRMSQLQRVQLETTDAWLEEINFVAESFAMQTY